MLDPISVRQYYYTILQRRNQGVFQNFCKKFYIIFATKTGFSGCLPNFCSVGAHRKSGLVLGNINTLLGELWVYTSVIRRAFSHYLSEFPSMRSLRRSFSSGWFIAILACIRWCSLRVITSRFSGRLSSQLPFLWCTTSSGRSLRPNIFSATTRCSYSCLPCPTSTHRYLPLTYSPPSNFVTKSVTIFVPFVALMSTDMRP